MTELEQRLGLWNAEGQLIQISDRDQHIVSHYEREIARGRMTVNAAVDRAKHDLAGNNGHPSKPQRG